MGGDEISMQAYHNIRAHLESDLDGLRPMLVQLNEQKRPPPPPPPQPHRKKKKWYRRI